MRMDLRSGKITLGEVLSNPKAKALLQKELPELAGSPLLLFARNMTVKQILQMVKGKVPQDKITRLLEQLKAL